VAFKEVLTLARLLMAAWHICYCRPTAFASGDLLLYNGV
jgi:hypothetical protein